MKKKNFVVDDEERYLNSPHADLYPDFPNLRPEVVEELRKVYKDLGDCEKRLLKIVDKKNKAELKLIAYALRGLYDARSMISDLCLCDVK